MLTEVRRLFFPSFYIYLGKSLTNGGRLSLAFGLFVRALPKTSEFARLHSMAEGLELADSITLDGHKLLNVVRTQTAI